MAFRDNPEHCNRRRHYILANPHASRHPVANRCATRITGGTTPPKFMFTWAANYWKNLAAVIFTPVLIDSQIKRGPRPAVGTRVSRARPLESPRRTALYGHRELNVLNLKFYYRHLPIYEETAGDP